MLKILGNNRDMESYITSAARCVYAPTLGSVLYRHSLLSPTAHFITIIYTVPLYDSPSKG